MARPPARPAQSAQASRNHGTGNAALLRARSAAHFRRLHTQTPRRPRGSRTPALRRRRIHRRKTSRIRRAQSRRHFAEAPLHAADCATRPRRPYGWFRLDARSYFCRGAGHPQNLDAFLVGLAASLGAGISMAFAEALSDDGSLTGRGKPLLRGVVTGSMTTLGGLGHTLPFLISDFRMAFTVAVAVVVLELGVISYIRHRYMDMPIVSSAVQVIVGGGLVFAVGILIGSS